MWKNKQLKSGLLIKPLVDRKVDRRGGTPVLPRSCTASCYSLFVCLFLHIREKRRARGAQGNHAQLAREGTVLALIDLAKTECPVVRRNCASAMRSMTCKAEIRQFLIASGTIEVILDDTKNQVSRRAASF